MYIIIVVHYFTKWDEAMPTLNNIMTNETLFFFNHVIARFGVLKQLVSIIQENDLLINSEEKDCLTKDTT